MIDQKVNTDLCHETRVNNKTIKTLGLVILFSFTIFHFVIMYRYVVVVMNIIKRRSDYLMVIRTNRDHLEDLYNLSKKQIFATLIILTTTWLKFIVMLHLSDGAIRVVIIRLDHFSNYLGMALCVGSYAERVQYRRSKSRTMVNLQKFNNSDVLSDSSTPGSSEIMEKWESHYSGDYYSEESVHLVGCDYYSDCENDNLNAHRDHS
eukprot:UN34885